MFKFVSRKRKVRDEEEEDSEVDKAELSSAASSVGESSVDSDSEDGSEFKDAGGLTPEDVLQQPLITDPASENTTLCLVCPGRRLKNPKMIEVHKSSNVSETF
jgi:hypothetical protein